MFHLFTSRNCSWCPAWWRGIKIFKELDQRHRNERWVEGEWHGKACLVFSQVAGFRLDFSFFFRKGNCIFNIHVYIQPYKETKWNKTYILKKKKQEFLKSPNLLACRLKAKELLNHCVCRNNCTQVDRPPLQVTTRNRWHLCGSYICPLGGRRISVLNLMRVRQLLQMVDVEFETMGFVLNMLLAIFQLLILFNTVFCISMQSYWCKLLIPCHLIPGIDDLGLYRVVGVSSKVQKLLTLMIGESQELLFTFFFPSKFTSVGK